MKITKIRKGSRGMAATLENAEHHAQALTPFIKILKNMIKRIGFAEWKQGHNIHIVVCENGDNQIQFTPYWCAEKKSYIGIRISLYESRSNRIPLIDFIDKKQTPQVEIFLTALCHYLQNGTGNYNEKISH